MEIPGARNTRLLKDLLDHNLPPQDGLGMPQAFAHERLPANRSSDGPNKSLAFLWSLRPKHGPLMDSI